MRRSAHSLSPSTLEAASYVFLLTYPQNGERQRGTGGWARGRGPADHVLSIVHAFCCLFWHSGTTCLHTCTVHAHVRYVHQYMIERQDAASHEPTHSALFSLFDTTGQFQSVYRSGQGAAFGPVTRAPHAICQGRGAQLAPLGGFLGEKFHFRDCFFPLLTFRRDVFDENA